MKLRRSLMVIAIALAASLPSTARADGCPDGCSNNEHVCAMQATIESMACVRGCGGGDLQCRLGCRRAMIANRKACRSQRMDCITSCSPAMLGPDAASTCAPSCGIGARTCAVDMATSAIACIHGCRRARPGGMADCLKQCAATLGSGGSSCVASFQGCLEGCDGQRPGACFDTVTEQCTAQACSAAQPCVQPNEFCSPRCAPGPSSGQCFDTVDMQCSGQSCSSDQPCASANQVCLPQCPPPTPVGKCFDSAAQQCTDEACSLDQPCSSSDEVCTLQCPPPPPSGQCFDVTRLQCTDQMCGPDQPCPAGQRCLAACPLPTPIPQCSGDPCGGRCFISPACPAGIACPQVVQLGQCEITSAGDCGCVPYVPPTPQPPCSGDTCGGPCVISPPCPPGGPCPERPSQLGQCEITSSGDCGCVPYVPPTPRPTSTGAPGTPSPTPLPIGHCGGDTCGGRCWVSPCPPGVPCPALSAAQLGQCETTSSGDCECIPYVPPTPRRNAAATHAAVRARFRPHALRARCAP